MREQLIEAIATIDVLTHVDIREVSDHEMEEYKAALLQARKVLWHILRSLDSSQDN